VEIHGKKRKSIVDQSAYPIKRRNGLLLIFLQPCQMWIHYLLRFDCHRLNRLTIINADGTLSNKKMYDAIKLLISKFDIVYKNN